MNRAHGFWVVAALIALPVGGCGGEDEPAGPVDACVTQAATGPGVEEQRHATAPNVKLTEPPPVAEEPESIEQLVTQLQLTDALLRSRAAEQLGERGPEAEVAVDELIKALGDGDPAVRMYATWALGRVGAKAERAAEALLKPLADEEFYVRGNAAWALGQIAADPETLTPRLGEALRDADPGVRRCSAEALSKLGPAALPPLTEALQQAGLDLFRAAAAGLSRLGKPGAGPLFEAVVEGDQVKGKIAAEALSSIGAAAVADLQAHLGDDDAKARFAAVLCLGGMGKDALVAADSLVAATDDADPRVALLAISALGELGPEAATAVRRLGEVVRGNDLLRRRQALRAMMKVGVDPSIAPALIESLGSSDRVLSDLAHEALIAMGTDAMPALVDGLGSDNRQTRRGAMQMLDFLIGDHPVFGGSQDEPPDIREALSGLLRALHAEDAEVQRFALERLAAASEFPEEILADVTPEMVAVLVEKVRGEDRRFRATAVRVLANLGPRAEPAVAVLRAMLADENRRTEAVHALGQIGPPARAAVADLVKLLETADRDFPRPPYVDVFGAICRIDPLADGALMAMFRLSTSENTFHAGQAMRVFEAMLQSLDADIRESIDVDVLVYAARHCESSLAIEAVKILGEIGPPAKAAVDELIPLAESRDYRLADVVKFALCGIAPADKRVVLATVVGDSDNRRLLHRLGRQSVPALVELLQDENYYTRELTMDVLKEMGPMAEGAVPALLKIISTDFSADEDRRSDPHHAGGALAGIGQPAVVPLVQLIRDGDDLARHRAVEVLSETEAQLSAALPAVVVALEDEVADARYAAAGLLGKMGADAESALPKLRSMLDDELHVRKAARLAIQDIEEDVQRRGSEPRVAGHAPSAFDTTVPLEDLVGQIESAKVKAVAQTLLDWEQGQLDDEHYDAALEKLTAMGPDAAEAAPLLVRFVTDYDLSFEADEAEPLAKIGAAAVPALTAALSAAEPSARRRAAYVLGRIGPAAKSSVEPLIRLAGDEDCREAAVGALSAVALEDPRALPVFVEALVGSTESEALEAFRALGPAAKPAIPALIEPFADPRFRHLATFEALGLIGAASIAPMAELVEEGTERQRENAADTLECIAAYEEDLPLLIQLATDKRPTVRQTAVRVLGEMRFEGERSVSSLVIALADEDPGVSKAAEDAFSWFPWEHVLPLSAEAEVVAGHLIEGPNERLRALAALALGKTRPVEPKIIPVLISYLRKEPLDSIGHARAHAIECLSTMDAAVVPALVETLSHPDEEVRLKSMEILEKIGPEAEAALPTLLKSIDTDRDPHFENIETRLAALRVIGSIGPAARSAVPQIIAVAPHVRVFDEDICGTALERIGLTEEHLPLLIEVVKNDESSLAVWVRKHITSFQEAAVPQLIELFGDDREQVRLRAVAMLGAVGPAAADAVPILIQALDPPQPDPGEPGMDSFRSHRPDRDFSGRVAIVRTLGRIGPAAASAVPRLIQVYREEDSAEDLRGEVVRALGRIGSGAREALPDLRAWLDEEDIPQSRTSILALTLAQLAPSVKEAAPDLPETVVPILVEALAAIDTEMQGVFGMLQTFDAQAEATEIVVALGNLETAAAAAVDVLMRIAEAPLPEGTVDQSSREARERECWEKRRQSAVDALEKIRPSTRP